MSIYLDYNATTPVAPDVQEVICTTLKNAWGNPSSSYDPGKYAKSIIEDARRKVAEMIGSAPQEIVFTSGGTESNNMVIHTAIESFYERRNSDLTLSEQKPHIITTNIEHDSIRIHLEELESKGKIDVTFLPVSLTDGVLITDEIVSALRPNTCLITVMLANNETGMIQPVAHIKSRLKEALEYSQGKLLRSILVHTDATQALGKIEVDVDDIEIDYLTIAGHKFYGPRIGALYVKHGKPLYPILYGGGQEKNYRPGTENTCMIAGLGKAAELVTLNLSNYNRHMSAMRDHLETCLKTTFMRSVLFNTQGNDRKRLPNTVSVAFDFDYLTGESLLNEAKEVCASTGAACHSNKKESCVLVNSGVLSKMASKTVRLSVGRETSIKDIEMAVKCLQKAVRKLRRS